MRKGQKYSRIAIRSVLVLSWLLVACSNETTAVPPTPVTPVNITSPATVAVTAKASLMPDPTVVASTSTVTTGGTAEVSLNPTKKVMPEVGMNLYLENQSEAVVSQTIGWLKELGVNWIRLPLYWNEIEAQKDVWNWAPEDQAIDRLNQAGIHIMLNAIHCPVWAAVDPKQPGLPRDNADFASFMAQAASRYKGRVAAYEIWNEPNLAREAGSPINVGNFVALLKASYPVIKGIDPAALVVTGGLTPTGVNQPDLAIDDASYLTQFYQYNNGEVKQYFDVMGAHTGSSQNPPDTLWPSKPGPGPGWLNDPSFYFRRIEQIRQIMEANGDASHQIWLTEFGWASTPTAAPGFGFAALVSEQQQGQYLAGALQLSQTNYPWLEKAFIFQLNMALPQFTPDPTDERIAWGLIRRDGSKRPSFFAVQQFIKRP